MFCDLETVLQGDTGFEHRACFFDRQFQKMKCGLFDKFRFLVHGHLNIWTELLYLAFPHVADILTLIMSHKLTQHL